MAQTIGRVLETRSDGWALVAAESGQGCSGCSAVSHCSGGGTAGSRRTPVQNRIGAKVGDRVMLSVGSGMLLSRVALLYLLPVGSMLAGAFLGAAIDGHGDAASNGYSIGYALAGFFLGFGLSVIISRIWSALRPITPTVSRILPGSFRFAAQPLSACGCKAGHHALPRPDNPPPAQ